VEKLAYFQNALAERRVPALAELRARPILDQAGRPHVVAGNNALVARLRRADGGDVALRIVASDGKRRDWAVRYTALAELQETRSLQRLPSAIQLVRKGLPSLSSSEMSESDGAVGIAMEWIQGPTLLQGIDRAARSGNDGVIRALSAAIVQMWNEVQTFGFVHGDYTAQNLLVRSNGQIACVDLDTASWLDAPLGSAGEGSPAYRHPITFRDASIRDAFAMLVILTSLAALADSPDLRKKHGDGPAVYDGALLFAPWDLADPATSQVFAEARAGASTRTGELLDALGSACVGEMTDIVDACSAIPRFALPPSVADASSRSASTWDVAPIVARMRAHYSDTWRQPSTPYGDDDSGTIVLPEPSSKTDEWQTWNSGESTANEQVTAGDIAELKAALARHDEAEVIRIWSQVDHDPLAGLLRGDVESVIAANYDRRVIAESRRKRDAAVTAVADEAHGRHIPLGPQARSIVRQARERLVVQSQLDAALANDNRQQLADLAVSGKLVVLGDTDRRSLQRVLQAIEWPALQRAIQSDDDIMIAAAFDEELFEGAGLLDDDVRKRVNLARRRVLWLAQARQALTRRNAGQLRQLLVDPPEGGPERLSSPERRRIRQAIERQHAVSELKQVIESDDDHAIILALNKVERVGAHVSDRATWNHIQRVVERVAIIDELLEASEARPLNHARIAQLLPAIRALGLEHDPRLGDDNLVERLGQYVIKMAHVRRIRAAIARDNDVAIVSASVPDPRNALEMLSESERDRVAAAIRSRRGAARARA